LHLTPFSGQQRSVLFHLDYWNRMKQFCVPHVCDIK
jgi:hypothetical protein